MRVTIGSFYLKLKLKNPLLQLERSESALRRLCKQIDYSSNIDGRLVFINPEFHLFNAPIHLPIIYPTQLIRYMTEVKSHTLKLSSKQFKLAEKLLDLHVKQNPYSQVPSYKYNDLRKGVICPECGFLYAEKKETHILKCQKCNCTETVESAVLRSIEQLLLLFPDVKLTKHLLWDWCKIVNSRKVIQKILLKHFIPIGSGKALHYIKKN